MIQPSRLVIAVLLTLPAPLFAQDAQPTGDRITQDNYKQLRLLAEIDKKALYFRLGPGKRELTLSMRQGGVWIIDDENFHVRRKIVSKRREGFAFSKDQRLTSWRDRDTNQITIRHANNRIVKLDGGETPHAPVFSPDGKLAAIGDAITTDPTTEGSGYSLVRIYDTTSGQLLHTLEQSKSGWAGVRPVFSPDGRLLAVGNRNYETRLFDVATGRLLRTLPKRMTHEIAFSPDGKTLAAGYVDGTVVLWDVQTGGLLRSAKSCCQRVFSVCWNPKGNLLATAGRDGNVQVWNPENMEVLCELMDAYLVGSVRFTRDGTRLLATVAKQRSMDDLKLVVWTVNAAAPKPEPVVQPEVVPLAKRPNILFAIADDWGFPHASAYGDPVVKTPNFDRIAKEGVLFNHAFVSSPSCTPSRGAILAGKFHWELKGAANLWSVFPDEFPTYPEQLKKEGYFTGFQGKGWGPGKTQTTDRELTGKRFANFDQFLKSRPEDTPFCYWLGTGDPHRPFKAGSGKAAGMDLSKIKVPGYFPDSETIRSDIADYYVEVQRFDALVGKALKSLEAAGELDNTIVVMTSDHGMPFPRCKSNLYDSGVRVPLAIRYGSGFQGGRRVDDFVSLVDLADFFLEVGGVIAPLDEEQRKEQRRLMLSILKSDEDGYVMGRHCRWMIFGKERHVPSQEAPDMGGYPSRGLRYENFLLIRNYRPDRWPNGTPNHEKAAIPGAWYADTDNGPTKTYMVDNRDKNATHRKLYDAAFGKRPEIELYDLRKDPDQLNNVVDVVNYYAAVQMMTNTLDRELRKRGDPRVTGEEVNFDDFPYLGGAPKYPRGKKK